MQSASKRSPTAKIIWSSTCIHPRNFGSHVTVHSPVHLLGPIKKVTLSNLGVRPASYNVTDIAHPC